MNTKATVDRKANKAPIIAVIAEMPFGFKILKPIPRDASNEPTSKRSIQYPSTLHLYILFCILL